MNRPLAIRCILALVSTSCGGSYPGSLPLAPTPMPIVQNVPDLQLNGSVYDNVSRPIAGATVEILDGPQKGVSTTSDASGRFAFAGTFDDTIRFRASKLGHATVTRTSVVSVTNCATCSRYVGFLLEVSGTPIDATGAYTMTFVADPTCSLPDSVRTRTYAASVSRDSTLNWLFHVSVLNASALHGYSWEGPTIAVAGTFVSMGVGNAHGSPGLVEQVTADTSVGFDGTAGADVTTPRLITMSAPFEGTIEACQLPPDSASPVASGTYICRPEHRIQCSSSNHRFTIKSRGFE